MTKDPGSNIFKATNLGSLSGKKIITDTIGGKDRFDFYKFTLKGSNSFRFSSLLNRMKKNADIALLDSKGRVIQQSNEMGKFPDAIDGILDGGTYYLRVKGRKQTPFRLKLSASAIKEPAKETDPDGTFAEATNLGSVSKDIVTGSIGRNEAFGRDENDYFRFSIDTTKNLSATLSNLTDDANLVIYNGAFQQIGSATLPGAATDTLSLGSLTAGTYYAQVVPGTATANTAYTLALTATNPPVQSTQTSPAVNSIATTLGRGTSLAIGSDRLLATDAEQNAGQLRYTIDSLPENGTLSMNGKQLAIGATFTQADINSGGLKYTNLPSQKSLGSANLVDILEVDGAKVFFTERDALGNIALKLNDSATGKAETLSTSVNSGSSTLIDGGIDRSSVVWKSGSDLFYYNADSSVAPVNITQKLPSEFQTNRLHNFYDVDGSNVIFESFDGRDYELFLYKGATDTVEKLTDNAVNDIDVKIDGNQIAWASEIDGLNHDVFLYDIRKGNPIVNAVNLTPNNLFGSIDGDAVIEGVSGSNVVFSAFDGSDSELFVSNGTPNGLTRLTNNSVPDSFLGVSGSTVVWTTGTGLAGDDVEIVVQDAATGVKVQTQNDTNDVFEAINGNNLVWSAADADGIDRLFYRSGTGAAVEITKGQVERTIAKEDFLGISGTNVVWRSQADGADQLFFRDLASGDVKQLTNITTGGGSLVFGELTGSNVLYSVGAGIFLASGNGTSTQVSPTGGNFQGFAQSSGSNVAWVRPAGAGGEEAFFGNFATRDRFSFNVNDGAGGVTAGSYSLTIG